ncbi:TPA: DUF131 domain-containing protein [Candidatus Bathyarchaeota archaeon]|nr:DUF131 domain-containing protein [Candidatus Bathyarchaeota archaeon]
MPLAAEEIFKMGIALALLGFGILIAGFIMAASGVKGKVKGGGLILVGPIPLLIGFGRARNKLIALILVFFIVILIISFLPIFLK